MCVRYADLEVQQRLLAFDTLATVGATVQGKLALDAYESKRFVVIRTK